MRYQACLPTVRGLGRTQSLEEINELSSRRRPKVPFRNPLLSTSFYRRRATSAPDEEENLRQTRAALLLLHFSFDFARTSCLALFGRPRPRANDFCHKNTQKMHHSLSRAEKWKRHKDDRSCPPDPGNNPKMTPEQKRNSLYQSQRPNRRCPGEGRREGEVRVCLTRAVTHAAERERGKRRSLQSAVGSLVVIMQESRHTSFASTIH